MYKEKAHAKMETINKLLKGSSIQIREDKIAREVLIGIYIRTEGKCKLLFLKSSWEKATDYLAGYLAGIVEVVRELKEEIHA